MNKFMDFMERRFVPVAARVGGQRHLVAIRDGFASIMPLILAGSMAVLLKNTIFSWIAPLEGLIPILDQIWWGSLAIMTLLIVFSVGYNLAKSYDVDSLAAGLIAVGAFFATLPQAHGDAGWGYIHWGYLQATGLFTGLLVALIATDEPMMFGLPLVLNPILFIPFILTPGVLTLIAYIGTVTGFAPATYIAIPWTTPPIIGAFLATGSTGASVKAAILAAINFIVAVLIYLPFIKLADRQREKSK